MMENSSVGMIFHSQLFLESHEIHSMVPNHHQPDILLFQLLTIISHRLYNHRFTRKIPWFQSPTSYGFSEHIGSSPEVPEVVTVVTLSLSLKLLPKFIPATSTARKLLQLTQPVADFDGL